MAAAVLTPDLANKDDAFATLAQNYLPLGVRGVVLAAGVAAMMSTASGALIAAATVARVDVIPFLTGKETVEEEGESDRTLAQDRIYLLIIGVISTVIALFLADTVTSLTIAYDILGGRPARCHLGWFGLEAWHRSGRCGVHGCRYYRRLGNHVHLWCDGE